VESAVAQAKAAARDKAVQMAGGLSLAQWLLDAGRVDNLHADIMPVFLSTGLWSYARSSPGVRPDRKNQCAGSRRENKPQIPRKAVVDLLGGFRGIESAPLVEKQPHAVAKPASVQIRSDPELSANLIGYFS
jgi:hypothetical protein